MTRDQKIYRVAYWLACFILASTLLSGYHKILYPAEFSLAVYRFHLLPDILVNLVSLYIQWLEVMCGLCLLAVPKFRVAALWITLVLLIIFTGAIGINLLRGTAFGCGCFSPSPTAKPMDWLSVGRNGSLILLTLLALWGYFRTNSS